MGTTEGHRLDALVTIVVALLGGLLMLAVAPLVQHVRLMVTAGIGALFVALLAATTPDAARMWRRHAYTAVSVPVAVLGTAAAEMTSNLRLGPVVLVCPLLAVACLRPARGVIGQLLWSASVYGAYLFVTLPAAAAVVGLVAGGTTLTMVVALVTALRTALDRLLDELRNQAERDPLTTLHNRHGLRLAVAECATSTGAVVLMDIDHFKRINDSYGHEVGDDTLVHFADALRSDLRAGEVAARLGGDEFLLLLPAARAGEAAARAERIRQTVEPSSGPLPVTASIGIAEGPFSNFSALLHRADVALYRAKRSGRNRVELDATPLS